MTQKERRDFVIDTIKQILIGVKHLYEQDNTYSGCGSKRK